MRKQIPTLLLPILLAFTFCIYIPLVSYFGNLNEFHFGEKALLQAMLVPFACVAIASFVLLLITNIICSFFASGRFIEEGASPLHVFIILVILCTWLEGFVLNRGLPQITGEMNLFSSTLSLLQDFILWFSALVFGLWIWRSIARHFVTIVLCLGLFLSMGIADAVMGSDPKQTERMSEYQVLEKVAFHPTDNVLVLVLDAMSTALIQDFLEANPEAQTRLDGFVFFENNMETASSTQWSLPSTLKGDLYTGGDLIQYQKETLTSKKSLLQRFASEGYDVYMSSIMPIFNVIIKENRFVGGNGNEEAIMTPKLYGLLFIRFAPYAFKNTIANNIGFTTTAPQQLHIHDKYITVDELFYSVLKKAIANKNSMHPTFQVHHLNGAHQPYVINSRGKSLPVSDRFTLNGLREQSGWSLHSVISLLDEMKSAGMYDSSTIVILGDHGDRNEDDTSRKNYLYSKNAAFLIKPAKRTKSFTISKAPTSNMYLPRFLLKLQLENSDIENLTSNLPRLRTKFYPDSASMQTFEGDDVTRIRVINTVKIPQRYVPEPVHTGTQYTFSMVSDKPNVAFPLTTQNADFVNGWGLKLLSQVSEFSLLVSKKERVNVGLRIETNFLGDSNEQFAPYTLTVRDLLTNQEQSIQIDRAVQVVKLKNIHPDDKPSIRLQLILSSYNAQTQVMIESIYLE